MVIVGVAGFARYALRGKALVFMTSGTGKRRMFAQQGKTGQRVIE